MCRWYRDYQKENTNNSNSCSSKLSVSCVITLQTLLLMGLYLQVRPLQLEDNYHRERLSQIHLLSYWSIDTPEKLIQPLSFYCLDFREI